MKKKVATKAVRKQAKKFARRAIDLHPVQLMRPRTATETRLQPPNPNGIRETKSVKHPQT